MLEELEKPKVSEAATVSHYKQWRKIKSRWWYIRSTIDPIPDQIRVPADLT
jgi:hypothetical protein